MTRCILRSNNVGNSFHCVVVGDVFFDVIVKMNDAIPVLTIGGTYYCPVIRMFPGGSGNVATALATLGVKSTFVGKAGEDALGKLYVKDLKSYGVEPCVHFDKRHPTGITVTVAHPNGERSFVVSRGANDMLQVSEIEHAVRCIRSACCVYITGYSLVNSPQKEAVIKAAEMAKELDNMVVFDPGAFNVIRSKRESFDKLLKLTDVLCLNAHEAIELAETHDLDEAVEMLTRTVQLVIVKLGSKGCMISQGDSSNVLRIPSYKVRCVDTTGAGDAFVAAVIFGLSQKLSLRYIGKFANWFAAKQVVSLGPRTFPPQKHIADLLRALTKVIP